MRKENTKIASSSALSHFPHAFIMCHPSLGNYDPCQDESDLVINRDAKRDRKNLCYHTRKVLLLGAFLKNPRTAPFLQVHEFDLLPLQA